MAPVPGGGSGEAGWKVAGGSGLGHRWPLVFKKLNNNPLGKPS